MHAYEVEIKSLLGTEENAQALREKMKDIDPACTLVSRNKQLNHYFVGGNLEDLIEELGKQLGSMSVTKLQDIASRANDFSVRTRDKDGTVLLVVKASVGDDTSANGVSRIEFEEKVPFSLGDLDQALLKAGFSYQAKWSREREEYACKGATVCLDKNAGYGWLAEFEKVVSDANALDSARAEVIQLMQECGVEELPQDRLERMFAHYNAHWPEYYGTDKIFTVH